MPVLLSQSQGLDQSLIAGFTPLLQIVQQPPALAHHLQQAPPAVMVFFVGLKVFLQLVDPLGEQGNLHFRAAGVGRIAAVPGDDFLFALGQKTHDVVYFPSLFDLAAGR